MTTKEIIDNFKKENPNLFYVVKDNEKLNKCLCFVVDYGSTSLTSGISKQELEAYKKLSPKEVFAKMGEKFNGKDEGEMFNQFYIDFMTQHLNKSFTSEDVVNAWNDYDKFNHAEHMKEDLANDKVDNAHTIKAYVLEGEDSFSSPVFEMKISINNVKDKGKVCLIKDTYTAPEFQKMSIHRQGINFLESYLTEQRVPLIVGTSDNYILSKNMDSAKLNEHYEKLGFNVYKKDDVTCISKAVDYTKYLYADNELTK